MWNSAETWRERPEVHVLKAVKILLCYYPGETTTQVEQCPRLIKKFDEFNTIQIKGDLRGMCSGKKNRWGSSAEHPGSKCGMPCNPRDSGNMRKCDLSSWWINIQKVLVAWYWVSDFIMKFSGLQKKIKHTGYWKESSHLPTRLAKIKGNEMKEKCIQYINTSYQVGSVTMCATMKIWTDLYVSIPSHCPFFLLFWNNNAKWGLSALDWRGGSWDSFNNFLKRGKTKAVFCLKKIDTKFKCKPRNS